MQSSFRPFSTARGAIALIGAAAAVVALVFAVSVQAARAPFKVLQIIPNSGVLAGVGKTEGAGMRAAANVVNRSGGILGSQVELTVRDSAGDGAKATATALQEIGSNNYNLVSCGALLAEGLPCAAAIDKTEPLKIPAIQDESFNRLSRTFGVGSLYEPVEEGVVRQMIRKRVRSFVHLTGDNASGRTSAAAMEKAARKHRRKIRLLRVIFVPVTQTDATPQIQQAIAENPRALSISAFTAANLPMLRARKKLGLDIPVYTDWLFTTGALNAVTAEERAGVTTQMWPWAIKGHRATRARGFRQFATEFNKEIAGPVPLAIPAPVTAWNIIMLARAAARTAKSTNPDRMVRAMSRLTTSRRVPGFFGVSKLYDRRHRNPQASPNDWIFVRAGTTGTDGYITPDR